MQHSKYKLNHTPQFPPFADLKTGPKASRERLNARQIMHHAQPTLAALMTAYPGTAEPTSCGTLEVHTNYVTSIAVYFNITVKNLNS
jgi:hypothetical protein